MISGCAANIEDLSKEDIQKIAGSLSEEDIDKAVACKPPYMRFGLGCCLDKGNNSICDSDEVNDTSILPDIEINPDIDVDVDINLPSPTSTTSSTIMATTTSTAAPTTTSTTASTTSSTTTSSTTISTSSTTTTTTQQCDPSYPTVCIPPYPPDLNCADITYSNFQVLEPDPHNFDGNNDGIGCQS